jgi:hypothetical protein
MRCLAWLPGRATNWQPSAAFPIAGRTSPKSKHNNWSRMYITLAKMSKILCATMKPPTPCEFYSPLGGLDGQGMLFEPERTAASCCTRPVHLRAQEPRKRMANCASCAKKQSPLPRIANRIVVKSSGWGKTPCDDVYPIEAHTGRSRRRPLSTFSAQTRRRCSWFCWRGRQPWPPSAASLRTTVQTRVGPQPCVALSAS